VECYGEVNASPFMRSVVGNAIPNTARQGLKSKEAKYKWRINKRDISRHSSQTI
jgi:hypothetical protein